MATMTTPIVRAAVSPDRPISTGWSCFAQARTPSSTTNVMPAHARSWKNPLRAGRRGQPDDGPGADHGQHQVLEDRREVEPRPEDRISHAEQQPDQEHD